MVIYINFKYSAFTAVNQDVKGYHLSIEGIQEGYLFEGLKKLLSSNLSGTSGFSCWARVQVTYPLAANETFN